MELMVRKPIVISECLPAEVCIETNTALDKPVANIAQWQDSSCVLVTLKHTKTEGCKNYFLIGEDMANHGTGQYALNIYDDCDLCDCLPIQLKRECFVVQATVSEATKKEECC